MLDKLKNKNATQIRFLLAGIWNTAFGYLAGVGVWYMLSPMLGIVPIAAISNVIAITMAFLVYKLYVFKSRSNWLHEYLRSYVVYGANFLLSTALLWLTVKQLGMNIWMAQAVSLVAVAVFSWFGNSRFTFRHHQ